MAHLPWIMRERFGVGVVGAEDDEPRAASPPPTRAADTRRKRRNRAMRFNRDSDMPTSATFNSDDDFSWGGAEIRRCNKLDPSLKAPGFKI